ncbi:hypothetical protein HI914_00159 [Erysiphe necator]|nr:hypothetical protein HI914_00159 [Erysiphe necator]
MRLKNPTLDILIPSEQNYINRLATQSGQKVPDDTAVMITFVCQSINCIVVTRSDLSKKILIRSQVQQLDIGWTI